jgi:hypothetical protein
MLPRSSFVILATLFNIGIVLVRFFSTVPEPPTSSSSFYHDAFGPGRSLGTWLKDEEERYVAVVRDRHQLIKKWGPTAIDIEP